MILNANSLVWIEKQVSLSIDHVITDFVYGTKFPFLELVRICKGNILTFCGDSDYPFEPTERAYWIKTPSTKNYSKHIGRFVEHIFIYRQGDTFNSKLHWSQYTGVYTDLVEEPNGHQWVKPYSLIERLVKIYTKEGDLVLDPFCGSGIVLKACQNLGRRFIGIDIDQKWADYCKERYE